MSSINDSYTSYPHRSPKALSGRGRYRTFWPRFWASFVDSLVLLPISIPSRSIMLNAKGTVTFLLAAAVSYSAYWVYSIVFHASFGATLGKMATGVKVLDISEQAIPTLKQAFIRDLPYVITSVLGFGYLAVMTLFGNPSNAPSWHEGVAALMAFLTFAWFALELFTMLTSEKRRALHDVIARTVVVRVKTAQSDVRPAISDWP